MMFVFPTAFGPKNIVRSSSPSMVNLSYDLKFVREISRILSDNVHLASCIDIIMRSSDANRHDEIQELLFICCAQDSRLHARLRVEEYLLSMYNRKPIAHI